LANRFYKSWWFRYRSRSVFGVAFLLVCGVAAWICASLPFGSAGGVGAFVEAHVLTIRQNLEDELFGVGSNINSRWESEALGGSLCVDDSKALSGRYDDAAGTSTQ
jgi:hypothetical protein